MLISTYNLQEFDEEVSGWWPSAIMKTGKTYKEIGKTIFLCNDLDVTAWMHNLKGIKLSEKTLARFLYQDFFEDLPEHWQKVCKETESNSDHLLRTWENTKDWSEDVDLVIISAALANMEESDIYKTNRKILNHIIENKTIEEFYSYYDPKPFGYVIILFWDHYGVNFLSKLSKERLM